MDKKHLCFKIINLLVFDKIYRLLKITFSFCILKNNRAFNKMSCNRAWCKIHNIVMIWFKK